MGDGKLIINGEEIEKFTDLTGGIGFDEETTIYELPEHRLISRKNSQSFMVEITTSEDLENLEKVFRGIDSAMYDMKRTRIIIQILGNAKL